MNVYVLPSRGDRKRRRPFGRSTFSEPAFKPIASQTMRDDGDFGVLTLWLMLNACALALIACAV